MFVPWENISIKPFLPLRFPSPSRLSHFWALALREPNNIGKKFSECGGVKMEKKGKKKRRHPRKRKRGKQKQRNPEKSSVSTMLGPSKWITYRSFMDWSTSDPTPRAWNLHTPTKQGCIWFGMQRKDLSVRYFTCTDRSIVALWLGFPLCWVRW